MKLIGGGYLKINGQKDQNLMELMTNEEAYKNFKSFYYLLKATPDSVTKVFNKDAIINVSNICELNQRVVTKVRNHFEEKGFYVSVHVSFSNKKSIDFGSWYEFENRQWHESEKIVSVVITWSFLLKLPKYDFPQEHSLMVKMSSSLKPGEMLNLIFSGNIEDVEEIEHNFFPIVARVDFIDRDLGDEFINIVNTWVEGLELNSNKKSKIASFLCKNKMKVVLLTKNFFSVILLGLGIILFNIEILKINVPTIGELTVTSFLSIFNLVFAFVVIFLLSKSISKFFARGILDNLDDFGKVHTFDITKGDRNEQKILKEANKKNISLIIAKSSLNVFLNILCGVISAFLVK